MLNESTVLNYIKTKLALPYLPLELSDDDILNIVRYITIPFFSKYIPDVYELSIDSSDDKYKTNKDNEFKILDPDGLPILNVLECIFDQSAMTMSGEPIMGLMGGDWNSLIKYVSDVEKGRSISKYSAMRYTIEFKAPNIIRIMPKPSGKFIVRYEREHKHDFSTIPTEFKTHFLDLAYADVANQVSKIRQHFREIQTPFGTVELNTDKLDEEIRDIRDKFMDELKNYNLGIIVDRG